MIGKGKRTAPVVEAMQAYPAVYFAAIGGAAALMASCVTSCEVIAYDDLGLESIKRLTLQEVAPGGSRGRAGRRCLCAGTGRVSGAKGRIGKRTGTADPFFRASGHADDGARGKVRG